VSELRKQLEQHRGGPGHELLDGDGRGRPPTEEELQSAYVAPGERSLLEMGVVFQADWQMFADGMARHSRAQVRALAGSGVPVCLQSISSNNMFLDADIDHNVLQEVNYLRRVSIEKPMLGIRHCVLHSPHFLRTVILPRGARLASYIEEFEVFRATVVYTSWERSCIGEGLAKLLARCGEIWVPCEANKRAFVNSGISEDMVTVVPFPYETTAPVCRIPAPYGDERVPRGKRFYHIGKWEPRKDQVRLLRCFFYAFQPGEASLIIKTHGWGSWEDYPSIEDAFRACGRDPRVQSNGWDKNSARSHVRIISDKISEQQMVELHRQNNIYITTSHGEAWDIPAFEARCAGNRLVHVGYGGTEDYAAREDIAIPYVMGPVDPAYKWEPDAQWAHYDDEDVVEALRAAEPPASRVHPPEFNARYSMHAVGELMKRRVHIRMTDIYGQEVAEKLMRESYG